MKPFYILILFFFISLNFYGQTNAPKDSSHSDCSRFHYPIQPEDYKTFKKSDCDKQFCGSKKPQELYCEAKYRISKKEYDFALLQLQCAYTMANCKEFKFQIIKTTQQVYSLKGDTEKANEWSQRVDTILKINPNIE